MSDAYNRLIETASFPVCSEREGRAVRPDAEVPSGASTLAFSADPMINYLFHGEAAYLAEEGLTRVNYAAAYDTMAQFIEPFLGEFVDTSDNEKFMRIANKFFEAAFWRNYVWVGKFTYEELINSLAMDETSARELENLSDGEEHYHLFYDGGVAVQVITKAPFFTHLETGLLFEMPDWKERLIRFEWGRPAGTNIFRRWFNFAVKTITQDQDIHELSMLCKKRVLQLSSEINPRKLRELRELFVTHETVISLGEGEFLNPTTFFTPTELAEYTRTQYVIRDRAINELGILVNMNPKAERQTVGENYINIVNVSDRQRLTLNNLKYFAMQVKKKWGDELEFALNGIPETASIATDQEEAGLKGADIEKEGREKKE